VVIHDKLVDFIHEEGVFTERVEMVMYFLFMFRAKKMALIEAKNPRGKISPGGGERRCRLHPKRFTSCHRE
jgi:hypothetical protein